MTDATRTTVAILVTMEKVLLGGSLWLYDPSRGRVSAVRHLMEQPAIGVRPDRRGRGRQADAYCLAPPRNLNPLQHFPIAEHKRQLQREAEGGPLRLLHLCHGHHCFVRASVPGMTNGQHRIPGPI